ncbi:MAG TPA: hypothetical protein VGI88_16130 [Verrucomicrobiae bacterium]
MTRTVKRILWSTFSLAALLILSLAFFFGWRINLEHNLNAELRAIYSAGLPASGTELNDWYSKVPDSQNAALVMTQALAMMREFPASDVRSNEFADFRTPGRTQPLSAKEKELFSSCLEMNASALSKMREAIKLPKSRYPIDFSLGIYYQLPHLAPLKHLARMEEFQALLDLDATNLPAANIAIENILGMATTLDSEPVVISWIVRNGMVLSATTVLERRLNSGPATADELAGLTSAFGPSEKTNLLARTLIAHRAIAIPYFRLTWANVREQAKADGDPEAIEIPASNTEPLLFRISGVYERDLLFYLTIMRTNIVLASLPPPGSFAIVTNKGPYTEMKRKHYALSEMFYPESSGAVFVEAKSLATSRLANTAIAIEQFRLAKGYLPENLATLTPKFLPEVPIDPFDGQPLRYRRLDKGYMVYSIGKDRRDHGGRERPPDHSINDVGFDITFTVER